MSQDTVLSIHKLSYVWRIHEVFTPSQLNSSFKTIHTLFGLEGAFASDEFGSTEDGDTRFRLVFSPKSRGHAGAVFTKLALYLISRKGSWEIGERSRRRPST